MFVTLSINDKKGIFLVDTGAGISLIDINQADSYQFGFYSSDNQGTIHGMGGNSQFVVTKNVNVKYEEIAYRGFHFYGSDLTGINNYFRKKHMRILGIIGSDFMTKSKAVIDYPGKTITLNSGK